MPEALFVSRPTSRPVVCPECHDTGLIPIDGAPPAEFLRDIPASFVPCPLCDAGRKITPDYDELASEIAQRQAS
jgi:hypothetical protein